MLILFNVFTDTGVRLNTNKDTHTHTHAYIYREIDTYRYRYILNIPVGARPEILYV